MTEHHPENSFAHVCQSNRNGKVTEAFNEVLSDKETYIPITTPSFIKDTPSSTHDDNIDMTSIHYGEETTNAADLTTRTETSTDESAPVTSPLTSNQPEITTFESETTTEIHETNITDQKGNSIFSFTTSSNSDTEGFLIDGIEPDSSTKSSITSIESSIIYDNFIINSEQTTLDNNYTESDITSTFNIGEIEEEVTHSENIHKTIKDTPVGKPDDGKTNLLSQSTKVYANTTLEDTTVSSNEITTTESKVSGDGAIEEILIENIPNYPNNRGL